MTTYKLSGNHIAPELAKMPTSPSVSFLHIYRAALHSECITFSPTQEHWRGNKFESGGAPVRRKSEGAPKYFLLVLPLHFLG